MEMGVEDVRRWSEMGVKGVRVRSNPKSNPDRKRWEREAKMEWISGVEDHQRVQIFRLIP